MRSSLSALALLVTGVLADHAHAAMAADDLALLADFLDARSDLHGDVLSRDFLLVAIRDATSGEVVGSQFHLHLVAGQDADVVHAHLSGDVREDLVTRIDLDAELGVGEGLYDRAFEDEGMAGVLPGLVLAYLLFHDLGTGPMLGGAIVAGLIGRSTSAVRPCPWRSGRMTVWSVASASSTGPNVSPEPSPVSVTLSVYSTSLSAPKKTQK